MSSQKLIQRADGQYIHRSYFGLPINGTSLHSIILHQPRSFWQFVPLIIACVLMVWGMLMLTSILPTAHAAVSNDPAQQDDGILALYVLAFDDNPDNLLSLTTYYTPTITSIVSATANSTNKIAVVLVDLDSYGDTHLLVIQGGETERIDDLPFGPANEVRTDPTREEGDMADGELLGNFIKWSRENHGRTNVTFSFVGHGAPLVPNPTSVPVAETGLAGDLEESMPSTPIFIQPLPPRWAAHSSNYTDFHGGNLLSIDALAQALKIGTDEGQEPLDVLDLIHCFSASIEELYTLYPYAHMIAAAPNYTYAKPDMLGVALDGLEEGASASQMAESLVETYHNALPDEGHPRLLLSLDSQKIAPIKEAWDETALHLKTAFDEDYATTRERLKSAYSESAKYDTTLCEEEQGWELDPPDALSDMADFAQRLGMQFEAGSDVRQWSETASQLVEEAIQSRHVVTGTPWFAQPLTDTLSAATQTITTSTPENLAVWSFDGSGISMFTDLDPRRDDTGSPIFSWQSRWYTSGNTFGPEYTPYKFLTDSATGVSWADILDYYWADEEDWPYSTNIDCAPSFLSSRGAGELKVQPLAAENTILVTETVTFTATIETVDAATNPVVSFQVTQDENVLFSAHTVAGYLEAGSQQVVEARASWTPFNAGTYELTITVDVDDRFMESNETDNIQRQTIRASDSITEANYLYLPTIMR